MLRQVRDIFAQIANTKDAELAVATPKNIVMSGMLYNYHLNLYRDSHIMLNQQERVLNDGEHCQVIIDGLRNRLRMPRTELFNLRVSALRAHLNSYNPRDIQRIAGDRVVVPVPVARAMNATMLLTTAYVFDYFSEIKNSDYVRWLRQLKQDGVTYAGPGSLQETFNTYMNLHYLAGQLQSEALPARLWPNWTRQPASPDNSRHIPDPGTHINVRELLTPKAPK